MKLKQKDELIDKRYPLSWTVEWEHSTQVKILERLLTMIDIREKSRVLQPKYNNQDDDISISKSVYDNEMLVDSFHYMFTTNLIIQNSD